MDEKQFKYAIYKGLDVDLKCGTYRPTFGQLFRMLRGFDNPNFPAETEVEDLSELGIDQVDDYWGLRPDNPDVGDDVLMWLFPLVNGDDVYHHPGPFDGLRLSYSVLGNPPERLPIYLGLITRLAQAFAVTTAFYVTGAIDLGNPPNLKSVEEDAQKIMDYWRGQGIEPGSDAALRLDY